MFLFPFGKIVFVQFLFVSEIYVVSIWWIWFNFLVCLWDLSKHWVNWKFYKAGDDIFLRGVWLHVEILLRQKDNDNSNEQRTTLRYGYMGMWLQWMQSVGFLFKVAFAHSCSNFDSYTLLIKDGWIGEMYVMHSLIGRKKRVRFALVRKRPVEPGFSVGA